MKSRTTIDPFRDGNAPREVLRRFILWTIIASVSAAPSFLIARTDFHVGAMILGVLLFVLFLTGITCTKRFDRIKRKHFVRRTLYIGYGARLALSMLFPLGMAIDMFPGMLSVFFVRSMIGDGNVFMFTLVTTLVQGAILNTVIFLFMLIVYGIQRRWCRIPLEHGCKRCGYDLRASQDIERCPECGTRIAAPDPVVRTMAA